MSKMDLGDTICIQNSQIFFYAYQPVALQNIRRASLTTDDIEGNNNASRYLDHSYVS